MDNTVAGKLMDEVKAMEETEPREDNTYAAY